MIKWYDSIVVKVLAFFMLFATILLISMIGTFSVVSKEQLKDNAYTKAILTSEKIVATLEKAQMRIEELATVLANMGETLTLDDTKNRALIRKMIDTGGHTNVVSGGVWPEPYALHPDRERSSYFFARDEQGQLQYIESYNDLKNDDYHKKEWYVPARFFKKDQTYWSRVYIDPYTHAAMITATVGIFKDKKFTGAATIDIRLEGLDDFLAEAVKPLEGYSFLVDREGQFIAYPGQLDIKITDMARQNIFSVDAPRFLPMMEKIKEIMQKNIHPDDKELTKTLLSHSDEIDEDEAKIIASMIKRQNKSITVKSEHERFMINDDILLDDDAFVTVFTIPNNQWKLVVALPASKAFAQSREIYQNIILITVLVTLIISIIGYIFIRKIAVVPMRDVSTQLQRSISRRDPTGLLETQERGELGDLVYWFNQRSQSLHDKYLEIESLNKEIEDTQREVVFTMGAIGESRSKETGNHVKRVAEYSRLLAHYYGMDKAEAELLKQASPMHDIGKVAIPDAILNKPEPFSITDREVMDTHATLGHEMLKYSTRPLLKMASIVAYEHHEKFDGSGYPRALKGEDIHIYGRITALADVFDALGSARVYKPAWDDERIFRLFKEQRGKHFDPRLIDIFFEHLDEFLAIRDSMKDTIE